MPTWLIFAGSVLYSILYKECQSISHSTMMTLIILNLLFSLYCIAGIINEVLIWQFGEIDVIHLVINNYIQYRQSSNKSFCLIKICSVQFFTNSSNLNTVNNSYPLYGIFEHLLKPITGVAEPIGQYIGWIFSILYKERQSTVYWNFVFTYGYNIHNYSSSLGLLTHFFTTGSHKNYI